MVGATPKVSGVVCIVPSASNSHISIKGMSMSFAYVCFSWLPVDRFLEQELAYDRFPPREVKLRCLPKGDQFSACEAMRTMYDVDWSFEKCVKRFESYPAWQRRVVFFNLLHQRWRGYARSVECQ